MARKINKIENDEVKANDTMPLDENTLESEVPEVKETLEKESKEDIDNKIGQEIVNKTQIHLQKLEKELRDGFREVEVDGYGKLRIFFPTPGIESQITDFKADLVGRFIKEKGLLTRDEILNSLKERGVWTDEIEKEIEKLDEDIMDYTKQLVYIKHAEEIDYKSMHEIQRKRDKLSEKRNRLCAGRDNLLSGTIEAKIDEAVFKKKLILCTKREDGTDLWDSLESIDNEPNKKLLHTVSTQATYFWQGWSEDLLRLALDNLMT